jgi:hypothetical protein
MGQVESCQSTEGIPGALTRKIHSGWDEVRMRGNRIFLSPVSFVRLNPNEL